jgi:F0F1-type ATP synthase delta subunit
MANSAVTRTQLADAILDSLGTESSEQVAKDVAEYLLKNGKTAELSSLMRDVASERAERDGIVEVTATAAHPLDKAEEAEIERVVRLIYPNSRQVIINHRLDPSAVGGIRLNFAHKQLDMTVKSKLTRLRSLIG